LSQRPAAIVAAYTCGLTRLELATRVPVEGAAPIAVSERLGEALSPEGRAVLMPLGEVTLAGRKPPMRGFGVRGAGDIS
jgi:class 3 adenylate cyclase